ncbi:MAG: TonB-dependent receptor [Bacteroidales bacterium]|nr:TonB-dependent receptor [Bacteroidales bacterium]
MKFKFSLAIFIILFNIFSFSQTIKVIDFHNQTPIENVAIYNSDNTKTALTDKYGNANIDKLNKNDILTFQHPSYNNVTLTYDAIKASNFIIKLHESFIKLSEFVVSASKWEQNKNEVPNKIVSISAKDVELENPQTAADLLGTSNEVFIQKSQLGGGSPMIRGFSANSILLVIDGVRMNNAIYRSGNLQNVISLDPNIIQSSEIIFGPGSIIYGSDALGGVIDFHTKKVKLAFGNNSTNLSTNSMLRYSTANNEKSGHIDFNFGKKKWGFLTSVSFSDYDDLKMGTIHNDIYERHEYVGKINGQDTILKNKDPNSQKFSGYNQINLMQKIRFRLNKNIDINYNFQYSNTSDIPRYDRLIQYSKGELKYAKWNYGPQKWMMNALNIKLSDISQLFDEAKITLAFQDLEESRIERKFKSETLRIRTEKVQAYSMNFDLDKKLSKKNTLFYGIEAIYNKVVSTGIEENILTGNETPTASRYPDGKNNYYSLAAYGSFKSNINKKFTFTSGLRFNYTSLNSTFIDTSFYDFPFNKIDINNNAITASIGLVFKPENRWQFNINISSGFRAPNLDDVAKVFDSEPGNVVVPNENLKPEYVYNMDFSINKNFNDKAKISTTIFYTRLIDAMVRRDFSINGKDSIMYDGELSKVEAVVNAGKAYIYGGSISVLANFSNNFIFKTFLTYTHGEDDENIHLRHVSPLFGSTSLLYKIKNTEIEFYANYNGEISYKNLAPSEREKAYMYAIDGNGNPYSPAWFTINLKTSYQMTPNLQIGAGIENILDYRYRPYSSGICASGRNFIISLRGKL